MKQQVVTVLVYLVLLEVAPTHMSVGQLEAFILAWVLEVSRVDGIACIFPSRRDLHALLPVYQ